MELSFSHLETFKISRYYFNYDQIRSSLGFDELPGYREINLFIINFYKLYKLFSQRGVLRCVKLCILTNRASWRQPSASVAVLGRASSTALTNRFPNATWFTTSRTYDARISEINNFLRTFRNTRWKGKKLCLEIGFKPQQYLTIPNTYLFKGPRPLY